MSYTKFRQLNTSKVRRDMSITCVEYWIQFDNDGVVVFTRYFTVISDSLSVTPSRGCMGGDLGVVFRGTINESSSLPPSWSPPLPDPPSCANKRQPLELELSNFVVKENIWDVFTSIDEERDGTSIYLLYSFRNPQWACFLELFIALNMVSTGIDVMQTVGIY